MKRRRLSEEDKRLWAKVTAEVKPLAPPPDLDAPTAQDAVTPPPAAEDTAKSADGPPSLPKQKPKPTERHLRPTGSIDRRTLRKLARGTMHIDARIDLHGMTQDEAHAALVRFVEQSVARRRRFVLVITGKGSGGEGRGVLRRAVPHWLDGRELARHIVGYRPAQPPHGGDGALYVRLRPPR